jgi:hypothetical protein
MTTFTLYGPESDVNKSLSFANMNVFLLLILSRVGVTIDGVWVGEWIYWPLTHTPRHYKQLQHQR